MKQKFYKFLYDNFWPWLFFITKRCFNAGLVVEYKENGSVEYFWIKWD